MKVKRMPNPYTGIARVVKLKSGKHKAEIIIDGTTTPIDLMYTGNESRVKVLMYATFPNISLVTDQVFKCELDHIKLFDTHSNGQSFTPEWLDEALEEHIAKQTLNQDDE